MSLLDGCDPNLREGGLQLFDICQAAGVKPRITSGFRTYAKQESLYRAYIEGRSRYPAAPPGTSAHEYGYAFDMVVVGATNQADVGDVWRKWGGAYGGEEDPVHFEISGWRSLVNLPTTEARSGRVPPTIPSPSTPGTTTEQAVDILLSMIPFGLGGIIGRAALINAFVSLLGPSWETEVLWWVSHPAEFVRWFYEEWAYILGW